MKEIHLGTRLLWMVVVPTVACFATWAVVSLDDATDTPAGLVVAAVLPLLGLACVPVYRHLTHDYVNWWPYVVPALVTLAFAATTIDLARAVAQDPNGAFIPIAPYGLGMVLPFVMALGSLGSYVALGVRPVAPRTQA